MAAATSIESAAQAAAQKLDAHLREIIAWHFSPETGTPFWLDWAKKAGWNPVDQIKTIADLKRFDHFQDDWLRDEPNERWVPRAYAARPFHIFETGGTTGMPKQRVSWEDHKVDYSEFSGTLNDEFFPRGSKWLMVGPTGPRRLRLAIEHLANVRGGSCYHVDLDPRWVVKLIAQKKIDQANDYKQHVIDQAVTQLKHRTGIHCLFTTPKLLEALGEKINVPDAGIKGVFCGGTSMTPQMIRFLTEEVLENRAAFVPTYGNTLMGLACSKPLEPEDNWSATYFAPQPRAVLRVIDPKNPNQTVGYGEWGRVELSTLTKEFFMPRFLERDECIRRPPCALYPWDGVRDVRPFGMLEKKIVEGVY
jgi:phenylacetate-coenzyme A ligase PaaK-like adenylate-forming protein